MVKNNTSDHWSRYWQFGALTSLPQDFSKNYDGELADFWKQVIEDLPSDAEVIDVCTGNLALPVLMKQIANSTGKQIKFSGVDAASIDKSVIASQHPELADVLNDVVVIDNTTIEKLTDVVVNPVDLITSQYGIEYCDTEKVAPVLFKSLKPGGRFVFVAHATETAISGFMQQERQAFEFLQKLAVFDTLIAFAEGRMKAKLFQGHVKKSLKKIHEALAQKPVQLLQIVHQALGGLSQLNLKQLISQKQKIGQFSSQHLMAQLRANDLLQVIEKMQNNPEWYAPFLTTGLTLESKEAIIYQGKHHAGTAYCFSKPK